MTTYEMICRVNTEMMQAKTFSQAEKREITEKLLLSVSGEDAVRRFHRGVNAAAVGGILYPLFYIPPYNNGKKLRLFTGELPKTHILAANHYELEALRLLALWDADNPRVRHMLDETAQRLRTTCFAHFCSRGECVGAGISALRFLSALPDRDEQWMEEIWRPLLRHCHAGAKDKLPSKIDLPVYYMYAALLDIDNEPCRVFLESKKEWLLHMLSKGCLTGPAVQDTYNVLRLSVLRNALCMLPEYRYVKDRPVYVSEKNHRCYCDTRPLV